MAQVTRSTKVGGGTVLQSNTLARATDVETDMLTLFSAHNNHDDGTSKWQVLSAENSSSTVAILNNSTGTNDILDCRDNGSSVFKVADGGTVTLTGALIVPTITVTTLTHGLIGYRQPNLKYVSATAVDVESNTGTSNQTTVLFRDGSLRSVTEDTASTNKYRRFLITAAAEFTSGTEDSGLRSGISEVANTRYAIYAVKSVIDATKFVLAGDTTFPTQSNVATLNTRYGTSGWVFLGYLFNGNGQAGSSDIMDFLQAGPSMDFRNTNSAGVGAGLGILMATTAGATTLTYTYAAGSGNAQIPDTITKVHWGVHWESVAGGVIAKDAGGARTYITQDGNSATHINGYWSAATEGVALSNGPASSEAQDIFMRSYFDSALANGVAPLF
jgi:hypothetical protein